MLDYAPRHLGTQIAQHMEDSVCGLYKGHHKIFICLKRRTCLTVRGDYQQDVFPLPRWTLIEQWERLHLGLGAVTCAPDIVHH